MTEKNEDCSNCKFHSNPQIEKDIDLLFPGTPMESIVRQEEMEDFYECKLPGKEKEIGRTPIFCDNYESIVKSTQSEIISKIDEMIERRNKREEDKKNNNR